MMNSDRYGGAPDGATTNFQSLCRIVINLMCLVLIGMVTGCITTSPNDVAIQSHPDDYVILIHGLTRSHKSMNRLQEKLNVEGYNAISLEYPSRKLSIKAILHRAFSPVNISMVIENGTEHRFTYL